MAKDLTSQRITKSNYLILILIALALFYSQSSFAETYDIGPEQTYKELGDIDWLNLKRGDIVNIHWKEEPYNEKIGIRSRGTSTEPIKIIGVKGSNGELPILDGKDAITNSQFNNFFDSEWDEFLGVILIKRSRSDDYSYKPGYIEIENLKIIGAHNSNTYTNTAGDLNHYANGAAAIWVVVAEHLTIKNCIITDNGNGLFVLSKNNAEEDTSRDITIEGNYVYGNGNSGRDREHNIYTQAAGIVFQNNKIGKLRDGALGSSLKDRSSGTIIRNNFIEASARAIDLVEAEDSSAILMNEKDYDDVYVYNNIITDKYVDDSTSFSTNLIHYGGDSGEEEIYKKGTLYFYNNTIYISANIDPIWRVRIFDLPNNEPTVEIKNSVLVREGTTNFEIMDEYGTANLIGTNYLSEDWQEGHDNGFYGKVNVLGNIVTVSDPSKYNYDIKDYALTNNFIEEPIFEETEQDEVEEIINEDKDVFNNDKVSSVSSDSSEQEEKVIKKGENVKDSSESKTQLYLLITAVVLLIAILIVVIIIAVSFN